MFSNLHEDFNEKLQLFDLESSNPSLHPSTLVETSAETSDSKSVEISSISQMIWRLEKDFNSQLNSLKNLGVSSHYFSFCSESNSIHSLLIDFDSFVLKSPSLCGKECSLEFPKIASFILVLTSEIKSDLSSCVEVPSCFL